MALLDVKERNYAKYVIGNILLPAMATLYFMKWLGTHMEGGGTIVVLFAQIGCEYANMKLLHVYLFHIDERLPNVFVSCSIVLLISIHFDSEYCSGFTYSLPCNHKLHSPCSFVQCLGCYALFVPKISSETKRCPFIWKMGCSYGCHIWYWRNILLWTSRSWYEHPPYFS